MASGSFKCFVDQKLGKFSQFFLYAILEWMLIIMLFIDGFLAFFSNEFAKFFELNIPCLLCTRIDHLLVHRNSNFYYNDSICEVHKKDLSSLAYCHVHKKLSEIKNMCEGCLLSFATEKDSDCNKYKTLAGILQKDIDDSMKTGKKELDEVIRIEKGISRRCCCCSEPIKVRSKYTRTASINGRSYSQAPAPSPRASPRAPLLAAWRHVDEMHHLDSPRTYDEGPSNMKASKVQDSDDPSCRTPSYARNRFFGIPLSDSAQASPRLSHIRRKSCLNEVTSEELEEDVLQRLKKQVHLDRKSLVELYMELDEERSASAIAANNAMAMITRLQAEKAAVEMEAFQYQRMMEEQAEYDQEALEFMNDELLKKEDEMNVLLVELQTYREKYGQIKNVGSEVCEVDADEDYQELKSSISERSDCASLDEFRHKPPDVEEESHLDFEKQRSYLMGLLTDVVEKIKTPPEEEERGNESKVTLTREVSLIRERLRAIEAESSFLKHAAMTLQSTGEGSKLLTEIAQHLQKLRHSDNTPSHC